MNDRRKQILAGNFHASMANHQITGKGIIGFGLPVIIVSCDNEYIRPGSRGVLVILEQGTDLSVIVAVFHGLKDDHTLEAPVTCGHPVFTYAGAI